MDGKVQAYAESLPDDPSSHAPNPLAVQSASVQQCGRQVLDTQSPLAHWGDVVHAACAAVAPWPARHANTSCPSSPVASSAHVEPPVQSLSVQQTSTHCPAVHTPDRQSPAVVHVAPGGAEPSVPGRFTAVAGTQ
jgi:hypothetical protein